MARKNRDDFLPQTIETLAKRVTYLCSNPDCGKMTIGPNSHKNKATNIGVAAHIKAAAPGGKRYDPNQTPAERSDIENGIWLCQSCSKLIDTDENKYTVEVLRQWKSIAEKRSEKGISAEGCINLNIFELALDDTLSNELAFDCDSGQTVLTRKMKKGEFDSTSILNAKAAKIHALSIISQLKTTATGRNFLNQIYEELKTIIVNKFYIPKSEGDLIKADMPNINDELDKLIAKHSSNPVVSLQFLMGLLYIATSNCAMKWKYGEEVNDEINS